MNRKPENTNYTIYPPGQAAFDSLLPEPDRNKRMDSKVQCVCGSSGVIISPDRHVVYISCDGCWRQIDKGFANEDLALDAWEASLEPEAKNCNSRSVDIQRKERADCTVCTLASATGIPYEEAWLKLKALGRKDRCGIKWKTVAPALGFESLPEFSCISLGRLLSELPKQGTFVVRIRRHVFTIKDGKLPVLEMDRPLRTGVKMVYALKGGER